MTRKFYLTLTAEGVEEQIILIVDKGEFFWRTESTPPWFWRGSEFGERQPLSLLEAATLVHRSVAYRSGSVEESNNLWKRIQGGE